MQEAMEETMEETIEETIEETVEETIEETYGACWPPRMGAANARNAVRRQPGALPRFRLMRMALAGAIGMLQAAHALAQNPAEAMELPVVEVIGTTPLPGLGTPIRDVPANVQVYTSKDLSQQRQSNIGEFLEQNPTSVTINSTRVRPARRSRHGRARAARVTTSCTFGRRVGRSWGLRCPAHR